MWCIANKLRPFFYKYCFCCACWKSNRNRHRVALSLDRFLFFYVRYACRTVLDIHTSVIAWQVEGMTNKDFNLLQKSSVWTLQKTQRIITFDETSEWMTKLPKGQDRRNHIGHSKKANTIARCSWISLTLGAKQIIFKFLTWNWKN